MTTRATIIGVLLVAVGSVAVFTGWNGLGVGNVERDLVVTVITAAALVVVSLSFEAHPVPPALLGSLLSSALVLLPPVDAGLIASAVMALTALRQRPRRNILIESIAAGGLTALSALLIQLILGGPLLTTGVFPQPGQPMWPGLLALVLLGAAWWAALVSIRIMAATIPRTGPRAWSGLALATLGVGFTTAFWSVLASIATNVVVGACVLGASVVLLAIAHAVERRHLTISRDLALANSERTRQQLTEAVKRADQTLVDLYASIHDGPLQDFSAAAALADLESESHNADEAWSRQRDVLRVGIDGLRALLRTNALAESSTFATLDDAVAQTERRISGDVPQVTLDVPDDLWQSLPTPVRQALGLVVQEALMNAYKHASASTVSISLKRPDEIGLLLVIQDDGNGFDPEETSTDRSVHLGQTLMDLRMARVGGTAEVHSARGEGTQVSLFVPLASD